MEEFHLLVSLPSDLATLALIILLPADGANARYARGAAEDVLTCSARALRLWQLDAVRKVNSLQPGGVPLVAYSASQDPTGHAAVHVVCHKNTVVATFRALAALKQQLQLKVSNECICLRLSVQDLQPALQHVLLQTLANAGWSQLSHNFLLRASRVCSDLDFDVIECMQCTRSVIIMKLLQNCDGDIFVCCMVHREPLSTCSRGPGLQVRVIAHQHHCTITFRATARCPTRYMLTLFQHACNYQT